MAKAVVVETRAIRIGRGGWWFLALVTAVPSVDGGDRSLLVVEVVMCTTVLESVLFVKIEGG